MRLSIKMLCPWFLAFNIWASPSFSLSEANAERVVRLAIHAFAEIMVIYGKDPELRVPLHLHFAVAQELVMRAAYVGIPDIVILTGVALWLVLAPGLPLYQNFLFRLADIGH